MVMMTSHQRRILNYLLLEPAHFCLIFEFFLMTQCLKRRRERFSLHLGYLLHVRRPHSLFSFLPSFQSKTVKEDVLAYGR
jgi:hypothetical protein